MMEKSGIPAVVMVYNQFTYLRQMVAQLEPFFERIVVVDNHSTFPPLLEYYEDFEHTLIRQPENYGSTVYQRAEIQALLGITYFLTDPDLEFNPELPSTWVRDLLGISEKHRAHKVGFALDIGGPNIRTDVRVAGRDVRAWESGFWNTSIPDPRHELYLAAIDTTACLVNGNFSKGSHIRVAGFYTCRHLPWYEGFKRVLLEGEYEAFLAGNVSTHWF